MINSPKPIRGVFFDLDDTLCRAQEAWRKAEQETMDMFLLPRSELTELDTRRVWENVHRDLFEQLDAGTINMAEARDVRFRRTLEKLGIDDLTLADELNAYLSERRQHHMRRCEGAIEVLNELCNVYHVGIITDGAADYHSDSQYATAKRLDLLSRVDSFTVSDAVGFRKPDIRIFRGALDPQGIRPEEAVFVGDSLSKDIVGANRTGMTSILIADSSETVEPDFSDERPDRIIRHLFELTEIL